MKLKMCVNLYGGFSYLFLLWLLLQLRALVLRHSTNCMFVQRMSESYHCHFSSSVQVKHCFIFCFPNTSDIQFFLLVNTIDNNALVCNHTLFDTYYSLRQLEHFRDIRVDWKRICILSIYCFYFFLMSLSTSGDNRFPTANMYKAYAIFEGTIVTL